MRGDELGETRLEVVREERPRKGFVEMRADGGRDALERACKLDGRKAPLRIYAPIHLADRHRTAEHLQDLIDLIKP